MVSRLACVAVCALLAAACGGSPKPPSTPAPGGNQGESITGRERLGWDQQASNTAELATFRYAVYVDGARSEMTEVSCGSTAASAGFACSGRLPSMTAGAHSLELTAFVFDGTIQESARSAALRVTVTAATAGDTAAVVPWASGPAGTTSEGTALVVQRVAEGLVDPVDMALAPDGRVLVAERTGRIHVLTESAATSTALDVDGGEVVGLALDPQFATNHLLYVLYSAATTEGAAYRVARFREVDGALAERAVVMNDIAPATVPPAASLRSTPDGRLLIALGASRAPAAASFEGKLLRVESDGSTPREQNGTPVVGAGLEQPQSAAWDRARLSAWIVDRRERADVVSSVVMAPSQPSRAGITYRLPERGTRSVAVYEGTRLPGFDGNVLLASAEGRHILRLRVPADARSRQMTTEYLLQDRVGAILLVAVAPDGTIYFATADAVGRILPG